MTDKLLADAIDRVYAGIDTHASDRFRADLLLLLAAARAKVPREPDELMLVCGWAKYAREGDVHDICAAIWRAMYDAALAAPAPPLSAQPAEPKQPVDVQVLWRAAELLRYGAASGAQGARERLAIASQLETYSTVLPENDPVLPEAYVPLESIASGALAADILNWQRINQKSSAHAVRTADALFHRLFAAAPPAAEPKKQTEDSPSASVDGAAAPRE